MIKVGSMIQSKYISAAPPKDGNIGLVMELRNTAEEAHVLAHVYYPKTRTFGWVHTKDMKVLA